ncbi:M23 family metallopeptidase [Patescibacteria group bacterium]
MKIKSFSLPARYRLDVKVVKGRKNPDGRPLLPRLEDLRRVRKGSKTSRLLRHIFEHKRMKRVLGANLAIVAIAGSFAPTVEPTTNLENIEVSASVQESTVTEKFVQYPTENTQVNQGYVFYHPGLDFAGSTGDVVKPFKNGVVSEVGYSKIGYGNAVIVDHKEGLTSLYAHLHQIHVVKGDEVNTNMVIGTVGSTGRSTGSHLHFEIRQNGRPVNPFTHLP